MKAFPAILLLCACEAGGPIATAACSSDAMCGSGKICFPDGCGDPGGGLVVEVTGDTRTGLFPQDFAIGDGGILATMNFEVAGPLMVVGSVTTAPTGALYTDAVTFRAVGESTLIPGVLRTYENTIISVNFYQMILGAGHYDVTATATDLSLPPQVVHGVEVAPPPDSNGTLDAGNYEAPGASFVFPTPISLVGNVVKQTTGVPPAITQSYVDKALRIQAFDPTTRTPLSQPADVASVNGMGGFTLNIDPAASQLSSISLIVGPREVSELAPTKTFVIDPPTMKTPPVTLEMGDFGVGLPGVPGGLIGTDNNPIAGATVQFSGTVVGGGTFNSRPVISDGDGGFLVDLLASQDDNSLVVTVYPPPQSPSGILRRTIGAKTDGTQGSLTDSVLLCPDRLMVTGRLVRPDGMTPSAGATVTATAVDTISDATLPIAPASTLTDVDGKYTLFLDRAVYRFDYFPGEQLPQKSRVLRIQPDVDVDAGSIVATLNLGDFPLSFGRTVSGSIFARAPTDPVGSGVSAPNALIRFFRVTSVEGQSSSLLLGQAVADDTGAYQVILPDHPIATVAASDAGSADSGSP